MKNLKLLLIFFFTFYFISCTKNDDDKDKKCETEDLGITELSKYSYIAYQNINGNQVIDEENSIKKEWRTYNDTLEIISNLSIPNIAIYTHQYFKKTDNCIEYLFTRKINHDDLIILPNGEGIYIEDTILPSYKIQEYVENHKFVAKSSGNNFFDFKFWIDFSPETNHPEPYYYEQFFP